MAVFQNQEIIFYEELIDAMYSVLLDYARLKTPDELTAEDVVQEACLVAWKKIDEVIASPNPQGWLMNALKHRILKYYEASENERQTSELTDDIQDTSPQFDLSEGEPAFLSVLNEQERLIISLKEQGYTHREIAETLGVQPGTVDSAVSRIKEKITEFLSKNSG
ncbi:MAG: sigma-70 family RNA polymerase sigma factor [Oscillospiraceae bacterium]|nr:sigma-70 family RNA polymerase sigma factor [Oscillospiraceae bacterium]